MILSSQMPTLLFYRAYVEGGEAGGISPLSWLLNQESGICAHALENALFTVNPIVLVHDDDDPLAVSLMDGAEQGLYGFCREVERMKEVLV